MKRLFKLIKRFVHRKSKQVLSPTDCEQRILSFQFSTKKGKTDNQTIVPGLCMLFDPLTICCSLLFPWIASPKLSMSP